MRVLIGNWCGRVLPCTVLLLWLAACGGGAEPEGRVSIQSAQAAHGADPASTVASANAAMAGVSGARLRGSESDRVKWRPGHYVTLLAAKAAEASHVEEAIAELQQHPALRGLQIRYTWAELEPARGLYDFSRIARDLDMLRPVDRRLFILLQTKSFSATSPALPAYLDEEGAGGGTFEFTVGAYAQSQGEPTYGRNMKLWKTRVHARLQALVAALGERFNSDPALEGVALTETALGVPKEPFASGQVDAYFANLLQIHAALRQAFPNTVTMQFTNYPKKQLPTFVPGLQAAGAGLGGPDTFLDDPGLSGGVYPYYAQLAGKVALGPSVQNENYVARRHGGPHDPPAIGELYEFARTELKANYLFWTRRAYPNDNPWADVLAFMSSPSFPGDAAGGLASACPSAYAGCTD